MPSIFSRIVAGEIPGRFVFRDGLWSAFLDIRPVNPGHCLLVPSAERQFLADLPAEHLAALGDRLARLTAAVKAASGAPAVNVVVNDGPEAGQEVPHAHLHVFPRFAGDNKRLGWPATAAAPADLDAMAARLVTAWR
jgi:histidine triad (HIT) family protein